MRTVELVISREVPHLHPLVDWDLLDGGREEEDTRTEATRLAVCALFLLVMVRQSAPAYAVLTGLSEAKLHRLRDVFATLLVSGDKRLDRAALDR